MTHTSAHPTVEKIPLVHQKAMGETCARKAHTATSTFSSSFKPPTILHICGPTCGPTAHGVAVEIRTGVGLYRWAARSARAKNRVGVVVVVTIIKI